MNEARRQMAMRVRQDQLVAEYDRAMQDRGELADMLGAAQEAVEQFRTERDTLKARVAVLEHMMRTTAELLAEAAS